jgi:enoyl-CoA hydratase/carnithine racemase
MKSASNAADVIQLEVQGRVGLIRIHRPDAMNALNDAVMNGLRDALNQLEADAGIGCVVLTGSEKVFAAGADIVAMQHLDFAQAYSTDFITRNWERLRTFRKPVIAAVSGFALGGGCELAMMCDLVFASETARFGQPEIKIGTLPGCGGTQRLPRAVGKALAMDLCMTGRLMDAQEALRAGLVSRVLPANRLLEEALATAQKIAGYSLPALMMMKEAVNRAYEGPLSEGIWFERRMLHSSFALLLWKNARPSSLTADPSRHRHGGAPNGLRPQPRRVIFWLQGVRRDGPAGLRCAHGLVFCCTRAAIWSAAPVPCAVNPAATPCLSAAGRFWLTFHLPTQRCTGISMPTMALIMLSM